MVGCITKQGVALEREFPNAVSWTFALGFDSHDLDSSSDFWGLGSLRRIFVSVWLLISLRVFGLLSLVLPLSEAHGID